MAEGAAQEQPIPMALRPVRCIVKLGGAAITNKGELESINEENLRSACAQLRQAMSEIDGNGAPEKVLGMDWSRKHGDPTDPAVDAEWIAGMSGLGLDTNFIVVHGAGSFGHFQASRSGVHKGGLHSTLVKAGFVATRISVTSLNQQIVRALAREGIPSVGMSPFACGWSTKQRKLASANSSQIIQSLHAGFVPVLHGDAVLDELLDCTILSGDVIIRHLAQLLSPKYVVFLRWMIMEAGLLYNLHCCKATIKEVWCCIPFHVYGDDPMILGHSTWVAVTRCSSEVFFENRCSSEVGRPYIAVPDSGIFPMEISVAAHDTTGGMETKILEAAVIARLGIDVYITKAGTEHSLRALKGDVSTDPEDWLGTIIRSSK